MSAAAVVLTVLTLNVSGPRRVHQGWQTRRADLAGNLAAEAPDTAAFQDIWRTEDVDALATAAGHPYRAHDSSLGIAVTSRKRILDQASVNLVGGGALRVGVEAAGAPVDIYAARLGPNSPKHRLGQLLALADFIRSQSSHRPLVILGDLAVTADDREAALFLDFLGARDLCVSHGDEMCGRTLDDRRVDYAVIPYASRAPSKNARTAFTAARTENDEPRPLSPHFGLAASLDSSWLKLRLATSPDGRAEALATAAEVFDEARIISEKTARSAGWLPWRGSWLALNARAEAARFAADAERARSAIARETQPAAPVWE